MEKAKTRAVALAAVWMFGLLAMTLPWSSEAQSTETCGSSLVPCANFLNATNPPSTCCDPLKEALINQKTCLCNILNDTSLLSTLKINITEAQTLPYRCNISAAGTPNICTASTRSPASTTNSTTSSPGSGKNAADIVAWSGVSIVLAVMASVVLY